MSSRTASSDGFRTARVASLQPTVSLNDLGGSAAACSDPVAGNDLLNILRLWCADQRGLPDDFCDHVQITSIVRQPAALLSVHLERVHRSLQAIDEPFDGTGLNDQPWRTQDLFQIVPVASPSFPPERRHEKHRIPGKEEVLVCDKCEGAGENACKQCGGSGEIKCTDCQGAGQINCERCGGAGAQVRGGERSACPACAGNGRIPCNRCNTRGQISCPPCDGKGKILCDKCLGHRKLKRSWGLISETWCESKNRFHCPDDWSADLDHLLSDTDVVRSHPWLAIKGSDLPEAATSGMTTEFRDIADDLCRALVSEQGQLDPRTDQLSGFKCELRGTYLYRVAYEYEGLPGVIVIGGGSNRVLFSELPAISPSLWQRFLEWLNRFLLILRTRGLAFYFTRSRSRSPAWASSCLRFPQHRARDGGSRGFCVSGTGRVPCFHIRGCEFGRPAVCDI